MGIDINNQEDKTYIVLGSPYSATSFVAKSLHRNGVKLNPQRHRNYEDWDFVKTNKFVIRRAGGDSFALPTEEKIMKVDVDEKIKKMIKDKKSKFWGFKDPRASLTIKKYFPHLDGDVYLICCFRKPEKIIKGYAKKTNNKVNKKFVDHYNRALISAIKEFVDI